MGSLRAILNELWRAKEEPFAVDLQLERFERATRKVHKMRCAVQNPQIDFLRHHFSLGSFACLFSPQK